MVIAIGLTVVFGSIVLPELTAMLPESAVTVIYAAIAVYVVWGERDARWPVLWFALEYFPTAVVIAIGLAVVFGGLVLPELTAVLDETKADHALNVSKVFELTNRVATAEEEAEEAKERLRAATSVAFHGVSMSFCDATM